MHYKNSMILISTATLSSECPMFLLPMVGAIAIITTFISVYAIKLAWKMQKDSNLE